MNFSVLKNHLFGFVRKTKTQSHKTEQDLLLEKYLEFSASRYLDQETQKADFYAICSSPEVQCVAIDENRMLIGTTPIKLWSSDTGKQHLIGEFIIEIRRRPANITFENISPTFVKHENGMKYDHPHIAYGKLCISDGSTELMDAINMGNLHNAVVLLLIILNTIDKHPYRSVKNWPIISEEGNA